MKRAVGYVVRRVGGDGGSTCFYEYLADPPSDIWTTVENRASKLTYSEGGPYRTVWNTADKASAKLWAKKLDGQLVCLTTTRTNKPAPISLPPAQFDALLFPSCLECDSQLDEEDGDDVEERICASCIAIGSQKDPLESARHVLGLRHEERQCVEWDMYLESVCDELEATRKDRDSASMRVVKLLEENERLKAAR